MSATWLVTTYPNVHVERLTIVLTAGCEKSGRKRNGMPARLMAGMRTSPIAMTPPVADMVNNQKNLWSLKMSCSFGVPMRPNGMRTRRVMVTTFESAGAHAAAKNLRLEFSNAEPTAVSP